MEQPHYPPIEMLDREQRLDEIAHILALGLLRHRDKLLETFPLASISEESVHGLGDKNASNANSK